MRDNTELRKGIDTRGLFYVLDVHKDEKIFTECPVFAIPEKNNKRGRPAKKPTPNIDPMCLDKYASQLKKKDWATEKKIRKTHKGWKELKVHIQESMDF